MQRFVGMSQGFLILSLLFLTARASFSSIIPMVIDGDDPDLRGRIYLSADTQYVESFNGMGLAVYIDGYAPIVTSTMHEIGALPTFPYGSLIEVLYVNPDHFTFYNFYGELDSSGRNVMLDGTAYYTAQGYGGRDDPPAYWPHAVGLDYSSLSLNIGIINRDYSTETFTITAHRVPEPGTQYLWLIGAAFSVVATTLIRRR